MTRVRKREALNTGRHVIIAPDDMTEAEYEALGDELPEDGNPLL